MRKKLICLSAVMVLIVSMVLVLAGCFVKTDAPMASVVIGAIDQCMPAVTYSGKTDLLLEVPGETSISGDDEKYLVSMGYNLSNENKVDENGNLVERNITDTEFAFKVHLGGTPEDDVLLGLYVTSGKDIGADAPRIFVEFGGMVIALEDIDAKWIQKVLSSLPIEDNILNAIIGKFLPGSTVAELVNTVLMLLPDDVTVSAKKKGEETMIEIRASVDALIKTVQGLLGSLNLETAVPSVDLDINLKTLLDDVFALIPSGDLVISSAFKGFNHKDLENPVTEDTVLTDLSFGFDLNEKEGDEIVGKENAFTISIDSQSSNEWIDGLVPESVADYRSFSLTKFGFDVDLGVGVEMADIGALLSSLGLDILPADLIKVDISQYNLRLRVDVDLTLEDTGKPDNGINNKIRVELYDVANMDSPIAPGQEPLFGIYLYKNILHIVYSELLDTPGLKLPNYASECVDLSHELSWGLNSLVDMIATELGKLFAPPAEASMDTGISPVGDSALAVGDVIPVDVAEDGEASFSTKLSAIFLKALKMFGFDAESLGGEPFYEFIEDSSGNFSGIGLHIGPKFMERLGILLNKINPSIVLPELLNQLDVKLALNFLPPSGELNVDFAGIKLDGKVSNVAISQTRFTGAEFDEYMIAMIANHKWTDEINTSVLDLIKGAFEGLQAHVQADIHLAKGKLPISEILNTFGVPLPDLNINLTEDLTLETDINFLAKFDYDNPKNSKLELTVDLLNYAEVSDRLPLQLNGQRILGIYFQNETLYLDLSSLQIAEFRLPKLKVELPVMDKVKEELNNLFTGDNDWWNISFKHILEMITNKPATGTASQSEGGDAMPVVDWGDMMPPIDWGSDSINISISKELFQLTVTSIAVQKLLKAFNIDMMLPDIMVDVQLNGKDYIYGEVTLNDSYYIRALVDNLTIGEPIPDGDFIKVDDAEYNSDLEQVIKSLLYNMQLKMSFGIESIGNTSISLTNIINSLLAVAGETGTRIDFPINFNLENMGETFDLNIKWNLVEGKPRESEFLLELYSSEWAGWLNDEDTNGDGKIEPSGFYIGVIYRGGNLYVDLSRLGFMSFYLENVDINAMIEPVIDNLFASINAGGGGLDLSDILYENLLKDWVESKGKAGNVYLDAAADAGAQDMAGEILSSSGGLDTTDPMSIVSFIAQYLTTNDFDIIIDLMAKAVEEGVIENPIHAILGLFGINLEYDAEAKLDIQLAKAQADIYVGLDTAKFNVKLDLSGIGYDGKMNWDKHIEKGVLPKLSQDKVEVAPEYDAWNKYVNASETGLNLGDILIGVLGGASNNEIGKTQGGALNTKFTLGGKQGAGLLPIASVDLHIDNVRNHMSGADNKKTRIDVYKSTIDDAVPYFFQPTALLQDADNLLKTVVTDWANILAVKEPMPINKGDYLIVLNTVSNNYDEVSPYFGVGINLERGEIRVQSLPGFFAEAIRGKIALSDINVINQNSDKLQLSIPLGDGLKDMLNGLIPDFSGLPQIDDATASSADLLEGDALPASSTTPVAGIATGMPALDNFLNSLLGLDFMSLFNEISLTMRNNDNIRLQVDLELTTISDGLQTMLNQLLTVDGIDLTSANMGLGLEHINYIADLFVGNWGNANDSTWLERGYIMMSIWDNLLKKLIINQAGGEGVLGNIVSGVIEPAGQSLVKNLDRVLGRILPLPRFDRAEADIVIANGAFTSVELETFWYERERISQTILYYNDLGDLVSRDIQAYVGDVVYNDYGMPIEDPNLDALNYSSYTNGTVHKIDAKVTNLTQAGVMDWGGLPDEINYDPYSSRDLITSLNGYAPMYIGYEPSEFISNKNAGKINWNGTLDQIVYEDVEGHRVYKSTFNAETGQHEPYTITASYIDYKGYTHTKNIKVTIQDTQGGIKQLNDLKLNSLANLPYTLSATMNVEAYDEQLGTMTDQRIVKVQEYNAYMKGGNTPVYYEIQREGDKTYYVYKPVICGEEYTLRVELTDNIDYATYNDEIVLDMVAMEEYSFPDVVIFNVPIGGSGEDIDYRLFSVRVKEWDLTNYNALTQDDIMQGTEITVTAKFDNMVGEEFTKDFKVKILTSVIDKVVLEGNDPGRVTVDPYDVITYKASVYRAQYFHDNNIESLHPASDPSHVCNMIAEVNAYHVEHDHDGDADAAAKCMASGTYEHIYVDDISTVFPTTATIIYKDGRRVEGRTVEYDWESINKVQFNKDGSSAPMVVKLPYGKLNEKGEYTKYNNATVEFRYESKTVSNVLFTDLDGKTTLKDTVNFMLNKPNEDGVVNGIMGDPNAVFTDIMQVLMSTGKTATAKATWNLDMFNKYQELAGEPISGPISVTLSPNIPDALLSGYAEDKVTEILGNITRFETEKTIIFNFVSYVDVGEEVEPAGGATPARAALRSMASATSVGYSMPLASYMYPDNSGIMPVADSYREESGGVIQMPDDAEFTIEYALKNTDIWYELKDISSLSKVFDNSNAVTDYLFRIKYDSPHTEYDNGDNSLEYYDVQAFTANIDAQDGMWLEFVIKGNDNEILVLPDKYATYYTIDVKPMEIVLDSDELYSFTFGDNDIKVGDNLRPSIDIKLGSMDETLAKVVNNFIYLKPRDYTLVPGRYINASTYDLELVLDESASECEGFDLERFRHNFDFDTSLVSGRLQVDKKEMLVNFPTSLSYEFTGNNVKDSLNFTFKTIYGEQITLNVQLFDESGNPTDVATQRGVYSFNIMLPLDDEVYQYGDSNKNYILYGAERPAKLTITSFELNIDVFELDIDTNTLTVPYNSRAVNYDILPWEQNSAKTAGKFDDGRYKLSEDVRKFLAQHTKITYNGEAEPPKTPGEYMVVIEYDQTTLEAQLGKNILFNRKEFFFVVDRAITEVEVDFGSKKYDGFAHNPVVNGIPDEFTWGDNGKSVQWLTKKEFDLMTDEQKNNEDIFYIYATVSYWNQDEGDVDIDDYQVSMQGNFNYTIYTYNVYYKPTQDTGTYTLGFEEDENFAVPLGIANQSTVYIEKPEGEPLALYHMQIPSVEELNKQEGRRETIFAGTAVPEGEHGIAVDLSTYKIYGPDGKEVPMIPGESGTDVPNITQIGVYTYEFAASLRGTIQEKSGKARVQFEVLPIPFDQDALANLLAQHNEIDYTGKIFDMTPEKGSLPYQYDIYESAATEEGVEAGADGEIALGIQLATFTGKRYKVVNKDLHTEYSNADKDERKVIIVFKRENYADCPMVFNYKINVKYVKPVQADLDKIWEVRNLEDIEIRFFDPDKVSNPDSVTEEELKEQNAIYKNRYLGVNRYVDATGAPIDRKSSWESDQIMVTSNDRNYAIDKDITISVKYTYEAPPTPVAEEEGMALVDIVVLAICLVSVLIVAGTAVAILLGNRYYKKAAVIAAMGDDSDDDYLDAEAQTELARLIENGEYAGIHYNEPIFDEYLETGAVDTDTADTDSAESADSAEPVVEESTADEVTETADNADSAEPVVEESTADEVTETADNADSAESEVEEIAEENTADEVTETADNAENADSADAVVEETAEESTADEVVETSDNAENADDADRD